MMDERADMDPNDWRTWPRDGRRLLPPAEATGSYCVTAVCEFSAAVWGVDLSRPRKSRRNVIRVLKQVDGRYVQRSFGRVVNGKRIDIRVRGGCRC
jgi:hypothetical protein